MAEEPAPEFGKDRQAVIAVGLALVVLAFIAREAEAFAAIAGLGGVASILVGAMLPWLQTFIVKKGSDGSYEAGFYLRERDAAAVAASTPDPTQIEEKIDSDDTGPPSPSDQDADVIGTLNYVVADLALTGIFSTMAAGPLAGADLRLYLVDSNDGLLKPVGDASDAHPWEVGRGAVGEAYATKRFVRAVGSAVYDETHKLTPEEQERYREKLAAVIATPVLNRVGKRLGVVSAAASDLSHRLATDDAENLLLTTSLLVSRVLIELLQWSTDDETDMALQPKLDT